MERLTIRNSDGSVSQPTGLNWADALERLAAYEDTGLEPCETNEKYATIMEFNKLRLEISFTRLCELLQAEVDGRCVVLPCMKGKRGAEMNKKTVYTCADQEHDAWVCGKCGYIENFEADGPEENGWRFCPACGREIVIADETSELTKKQWDWIMGRFSRAE